MNEFAERRFGVVKITKECLDDMPEGLFSMFAEKFFTFKCEHDVISNILIMTCASKLFDIVEEGCQIPSYEVVVERCGDDNNLKYNIRVIK